MSNTKGRPKGIPYMGSKQKIAEWVMETIVNHLDDEKSYKFVDIFGGGGSITTYALEHYKENFHAVQYNELNRSIYLLFKLLTKGDSQEREDFFIKALEWVSRERFKKEVRDKTAWGGYLQSCWTFGNNQKGYLFGVSLEETKKQGHEVVANLSRATASHLSISLGEDFYEETSVNSRRLIFRKAVKQEIDSFSLENKELFKNAKKMFPAHRRNIRREEALEFTEWFCQQGLSAKRVNEITGTFNAGHYLSQASQPAVPTVKIWELLEPHLSNIPDSITDLVYSPRSDKSIWLEIFSKLSEQPEHLLQLQQLERLQQLEHLLQLQQLERLDLTNSDYRNLPIAADSVVYCDAPYSNTAEYKEAAFDAEAYGEWLQHLTTMGVPVFVSEYDLNVEGFTEINAISKRSLLSSTRNDLVKTEKLYWNGIK